MPVKLTRPLVRVTGATAFSGGTREIILDVQPPGKVLGFRLKGTRQTYRLPTEWCYQQALRMSLAAEKADRKVGKGRKK